MTQNLFLFIYSHMLYLSIILKKNHYIFNAHNFYVYQFVNTLYYLFMSQHKHN